MQVARWGNSLAIRLPRSLVERLGLRAGDELEVVDADHTRLVVARAEARAAAVARMAARSWATSPDGAAFDREEANARR